MNEKHSPSSNVMNKAVLAQRGFTLIEVAIVLIIGGLIMASLINYISVSLKNAQLRETRNKMELIQTELEIFLERNGRYPCPAAAGAAVNTANFGREAASCVIPANVGDLPTRTLNLPDDMMFDSYKSRYTYAVTPVLTVADTYAADGGILTLNDGAGTQITNKAHYVIVSHGINSSGARDALSGLQKNACTAANVQPLELENCDGDNTFVSTLLYSDSGDATNFDDRVVARSTPVFREAIPSGARIEFNASKCPGGWSEIKKNGTLVECQKR